MPHVWLLVSGWTPKEPSTHHLIIFVESALTIPVANNIVDGAQPTVVWHGKNLKVSHIDGGVVTRMSAWLKKTYERLFKDGYGAMKLNRGMIHEYLGMTLD